MLLASLHSDELLEVCGVHKPFEQTMWNNMKSSQMIDSCCAVFTQSVQYNMLSILYDCRICGRSGEIERKVFPAFSILILENSTVNQLAR